MPDLQALKERCKRNGFELGDDALAGLNAYLELLLKWNKVMNLVGPQTWTELLDTLVLDSFYLAGFLDSLELPESPLAWDFGAGAGLPGIPLRMLWTRGDYHLVEAREKRALFLQTVLAACKLERTTVFRGLAQDFMKQSGPADLVVSRAFMPWEKLLLMVRDYIAPGGLVIILALTPPPLLPFGWRLKKSMEYMLPQDKPGQPHYFWALGS